MKQISIKLSKSAILDEVALTTEYLGAKNAVQKEGLYDRVATISHDRELLDRLFTDVFGVITGKFREFIIEMDTFDEGASLTLNLSNAYDDSFTASVRDDIHGGMVKGVASEWLRFTYPEESNFWMDESEKLIERAHAKLCHRRKPRRAAPGRQV